MTAELRSAICGTVGKFGRAERVLGFCLAAFFFALLNGHWIWMVFWLVAAIAAGFLTIRHLRQIEDILGEEE
jgi:hypothetical protein